MKNYYLFILSFISSALMFLFWNLPEQVQYQLVVDRIIEDSILIKKELSDQLNQKAASAIKAGDFKNALLFSNQAEEIATEIEYDLGIAKSFYNRGEVYYKKGELKQSLANFFKSRQIQDKELSEGVVDKILFYQTHKYIAVISENLGVYDKASNYYQEAYDIQKELNNEMIEANTLDLMATNFSKSEKYEEAINKYNQALQIHKKNNEKESSIFALRNIINNEFKLAQSYKVFEKTADSLKYADKKKEIYNNALQQSRELLSLQGYDFSSPIASIDKITEDGQKSDIYITLNDLGFLYQSLGELEQNKDYLSKAESFHLQAFQINTSIKNGKNYKNSINSLINIADIFTLNSPEMQKEPAFDSANVRLEEALKIAEENNDNIEIAQINLFIANNNYGLGNYDEALEKIRVNTPKVASVEKTATEDAEVLKSEQLLSDMNYKLSEFWELRKDNRSNYREALNYYKIYADYQRKIAQKNEEILKAQNKKLAEFEKEEKDIEFETIESNVNKLKEKKKEEEEKRRKAEVAKAEAEKNSAEADKKAAEALRQKAEADKQKAEADKEKAEAQKEKAEADKKAAEADKKRIEGDLQNEKKLRQSENEKQEIESQRKLEQLEAEKERENEIQQRNWYFTAFILVSIIVVAILIGLLRIRQANQKLAQQQKIILETNETLKIQKIEIEEANTELAQTNEEIASQRDKLEQTNNILEITNDELADANKHITESITYAQRIQSAMLPQLEQIKRQLPESFILFKPRDIVSGDFYFYFYEANKDIVIISAIDCTGHGVPGAFMSMIGNEILNEIVNKRGITEADVILNELHKGISKALKQKETENRDGMDMTMCVIDKKRKILECAAAKNPLFYIQDGILEEIKADKMPIGGEWHKEEDGRFFTKHIVDISKTTYFYMSSDGFPDQFGGPEGKKFMKGNMKKMLIDNHLKPFQEQHDLLDKAIVTWMDTTSHKGIKEKQVDDILIIGFKINLT